MAEVLRLTVLRVRARSLSFRCHYKTYVIAVREPTMEPRQMHGDEVTLLHEPLLQPARNDIVY